MIDVLDRVKSNVSIRFHQDARDWQKYSGEANSYSSGGRLQELADGAAVAAAVRWRLLSDSRTTNDVRLQLQWRKT